MESYLARSPVRVLRIALAVLALAGLGAVAGRTQAPASASVPGALQLAEHMLASTSALADETPYQLIDPVGPGGISQQQAAGEVTSRTMIGGIYGDNGHYSGGYGQQYLVPAVPLQWFPHGHGGYARHPGGWPR